MLVDPTTENGYRGLWNLQGAFTAIAGIAYAGYDSTYNYFYMLSTSGTIHLIGIAPNGDGYTLSLLHTIVTDKSLAITGQHMYQSLYYDMETGWIYWARFNGEDSSSIIAINEETEEVVLRGTFDEAAWPVGRPVRFQERRDGSRPHRRFQLQRDLHAGPDRAEQSGRRGAPRREPPHAGALSSE